MSDNTLIRRMRAWRVALLPVALTISATMIVLGILDATKAARRLPPQIGYIPVDSRALAVTSSLDSLWRNLARHTTRLGRPNSESFWADINESLRNFSERCIPLASSDDLRSAGLNPSQGLSMAVIGDAQLDLLTTLPVEDRDFLWSSLQRWSLSSVPVWLSAMDPDHEVSAFRLIVENPQNGVLCHVTTGAPLAGDVRLVSATEDIPVPPGATTAELFFAPKLPGPSAITLRCETVLPDGTIAPCRCEIDNGPCGERFMREASGGGLRSVTGRSGAHAKQPDLWQLPNDLFIGFSEDRLLISSDPSLIEQAEGRQTARRSRFIGDNSLLGLVDGFHAAAQAGSASVIGMWRGIKEPVAGSMPFAVTVEPDRLAMLATVPMDTFRIRILEQLIASPDDPPPSDRIQAPLSALINDPALAAYFKLADRFYGELSRAMETENQETDLLLLPEDPFPLEPAPLGPPPIDDPFPEDEPLRAPLVIEEPLELVDMCEPKDSAGRTPSLYDQVGNFAPIIKALEALDRVGPMQGHLLDVRDGVPEVVLVQSGLSAARTDRLVRETQIEMKTSRDIRILCHARARMWDDSGAGSVFPVQPQALLPYLGLEGPDLLDRYDVQSDRIAVYDWAEPDPAVFESETYRADLPEIEVGYLPPPVQDNDVRYLLDPDGRGEIDVEALQADAFRLAYLRLHDGSIAFGTDAQALRRFIAAPPRPEASMAEADTRDKLWIEGDPEQVVTLMLLHPQKEIRQLVTTGGFEVLDQYRTLLMTLRPAQAFDGLTLRAELAHD
ncbi:hypothetical protein [Sedimentitalea todarodis]|uniref:Uncharacterized protein n=1 Tax=Sedimentitalea todarodis TaxID=1631240 RepID=A0ABU3VEB4_9RHOB|nr:hypothetical protein [Sedimentitalea todarodis]MDU9004360.1 hypothetical protein [Sedimentitalea todarodis]